MINVISIIKSSSNILYKKKKQFKTTATKMEGNTGAIIRIIYIKQLKHKMHNQEIFTNTRSWPNGNHFCLHQIIYLDLLKICIFLNYICANVVYCAEVRSRTWDIKLVVWGHF